AAQVPNLPGPIVFIAMAETGVGLGQGVFEAYKRLQPERACLFVHSTRYPMEGRAVFEFAETHSHAPRQYLHLPTDDALQSLFRFARSLVLIDDEASTGNTFVNLARACRRYCPDLSHVHLATAANFMSAAARAECPAAFELQVSMAALIEGQYEFTPNPIEVSAPAAQAAPCPQTCGAKAEFGRLGTERVLDVPHSLALQLSTDLEPDAKILVLGTGEFMHWPFLLGQCLEDLGHAVWVQSTTRSPILTWGAVQHSLTFKDNYGEGVPNYVYNLAPGLYDEILICHETPENDALRELAERLGGRLVDGSCTPSR
ncbi:MAG TPA: phosphoribosyltransferase domain-containing protein, partial [Cellvibrionaceae bacterium]|nr:phosphoribosyltransferase domain-containing protein [Cellvibrionaceae bacterium]